jgi:hypothetical protein
MCDEPWYQELERKYGYEFCATAGYFMEFKPWAHSYRKHFKLDELEPVDAVIQYSGAFHPIHYGHVECFHNAINQVVVWTNAQSGYVFLHIDHSDYRDSKGYCSDEVFKERIADVVENFEYKNFKIIPIFDDAMPDNCSRNFTRLYTELSKVFRHVYFVCGGDRANYALTFMDKGKVIVSGRQSSPTYESYKHLMNDRIWFIGGNNSSSSTDIRSQLNKEQSHD